MFKNLNNVFLMLIVFLIPISPNIPPMGFLPNIRLEEVALIIFSFFWFISYMKEKENKIPIEAKELNNAFVWYLCLPLVPEAINILVGNTNVNTLTFLAFLKKIQYVVLVQIIYTNIKNFNIARKYILLIIASSGIVAIVGFLQYFGVPFVDTFLNTFYGVQSNNIVFTINGERRITSFFPNANSLTVYFMFISALIFSLIAHNSMKKYSIFLYFFFALNVTGIFLTGSRTGLFTLLIAIGIVFAAKRKWKLLIGAGALALIYVSFMPEAFIQRIYNVVDMSTGILMWDESFMGRVDGVTRVIPIIKDNLIVGIGYVLINSFPISMDRSYMVNLDSEYIRILLSSGLLGFSIYLMFVISIIKVLVKGFNKKNTLIKALSLGILAGFMGLMVGDIVGTAFRTERLIDIFWVLIAILMALKTKVSFKNSEFWKRGETP